MGKVEVLLIVTNLKIFLSAKAKRETFRLSTFKKCKVAVSPYDLAIAGFYYIGPGDRVRCFR